MTPTKRAAKYVVIQRTQDGRYEVNLCSENPKLPHVRIGAGSAVEASNTAQRVTQIVADIIGHAVSEESRARGSAMSPVERGVLTSS